MSDTPSDNIWIVTSESVPSTIPDGAKTPIRNTRGGWGEVARDTIDRKDAGDAVNMSAQTLEQNMTKFLQVVGRLFHRAEQQANPNSGLQLDEIELSVEISGEGQVMLIGNGAKAGSKGAIKLTFRRQEPK